MTWLSEDTTAGYIASVTNACKIKTANQQTWDCVSELAAGEDSWRVAVCCRTAQTGVVCLVVCSPATCVCQLLSPPVTVHLHMSHFLAALLEASFLGLLMSKLDVPFQLYAAWQAALTLVAERFKPFLSRTRGATSDGHERMRAALVLLLASECDADTFAV